MILGGAALTPKFVQEDCQKTYHGQVIYGKDAFSDLHFMDQLMPAKAAGQWDDRQGFLNGQAGAQPAPLPMDSATVTPPPTPQAAATEPLPLPSTVEDTTRSEAVDPHIPRPTPPFWGTRILEGSQIPWPEVFGYLDLQALIAGQWQFRKPREQSREDYDAFLAEKVYPILEQWQQRVVAENLLHPQIIYGYFPCQAAGNALDIYDPVDPVTPIAHWQFPRQRSLKRLCIADFFAPKSSGQIDVLPMQAVTVGQVATDVAKELFEANQYTDYLYFHGLAVQVAEALAEWVHARIRRELGLGDREPESLRDILAQRYPGSRYSFGYPACPNLQDQHQLLKLLGCDRIHLTMDESEQLYPEQSTTAIVTYHPAAQYFSA